MTRSPVVFLGPSLPQAEAMALLDAVFLPPVDQGAILAAVQDHEPPAIGIIDGAFGGVPAVRHKDILWALDRGIRVFGAASMGALRAAELADAGMVGLGLIYRWYRRTPLVDDDEVAVAMTPDGLNAAALSDALINMRVTFRRAVRLGVISPDLCEALVRTARRLPFAERTYDGVLSAVRLAGDVSRADELEALEAWLPGGQVDQKAEDARLLLRSMDATLRAGADGADRPSTTPFPVTEVWLCDVYTASRAYPSIKHALPREFLDAIAKNAG